MTKLFFFKENDTDDRDCVCYIDTDAIKRGYVGVCGACFSGKLGNPSYENVTTVLTKEEFNILWNARDYNADFDAIIAKLQSKENDMLFERVSQEEAEWLMDEYNLNEDDIEYIFNEYYGNYRDRAIVSYVYDDAYDLGYDIASQYFDASESLIERYFDFGQFGEDLISEDECYEELGNGRVVAFNY